MIINSSRIISGDKDIFPFGKKSMGAIQAILQGAYLGKLMVFPPHRIARDFALACLNFASGKPLITLAV